MNEHSRKWDEICFLLSGNINKNLSERDFENQVVRAIEVLGWREFQKEIERQPTVQLGRAGTLRPDLIIYGNNKKPQIVVEVKRPAEDVTKGYVIGQLRSYMRQMKSDFGFLIGSDLRIFYDGPLNPHSDPILLETIDFEKQSKKGIIFVELFNKFSFTENRHDDFLKNKLHKFNKKMEVNSLVKQFILYETNQKIIEYLRNEFPYADDEIFSEALQQVTINISEKEKRKQQIVNAEETIHHQTQNLKHQSIKGSSTSAKTTNESFVVNLTPAFIKWCGLSVKKAHRNLLPPNKNGFTINIHGYREVEVWMSQDRIKMKSEYFREMMAELSLDENSKLTIKSIKPYEYYNASKIE